MATIEKIFKEYYEEKGTTAEEFYCSLSDVVIREQRKKENKKRIYKIIIFIEKGEIHLVEEEEGQIGIKDVVYTDRNNVFGFIHTSLIAEDLKVKGYIIFNHGEMYQGTFKPYFKGEKHTEKLKNRMVEILKKTLLEREKKNDKVKK